MMFLCIGTPLFVNGQSANQQTNTLSINPNEWITCPEAYGTASYPGGTKAWFEHVKENMIALTAPCKSGKVWISFKVLKTGKLDSVEVLRGLCELADQNAMEIVRKSAPWNPECVRGKPIDSKLAILFNYSYK